jgi:hypothetical protein
MKTGILLCAAWIVSLVIAYVRGGKAGYKYRRDEEQDEWYNTVLPKMKRLECERDTLWRSAVSKKQRLNRLMRESRKL